MFCTIGFAVVETALNSTSEPFCSFRFKGGSRKNPRTIRERMLCFDFTAFDGRT